MVSESVKLTQNQAKGLKHQEELCAILDDAKAGDLSDRTAEATWRATEDLYRRDDA